MIVKALLWHRWCKMSVVTRLIVIKSKSELCYILNTTGFTSKEIYNISRITIKIRTSNVISFTRLTCKFCSIFHKCTDATPFPKTFRAPTFKITDSVIRRIFSNLAITRRITIWQCMWLNYHSTCDQITKFSRSHCIKKLMESKYYYKQNWRHNFDEIIFESQSSWYCHETIILLRYKRSTAILINISSIRTT